MGSDATTAVLKVAIIGSGPAGCYVAERLIRQGKGAVQVDVFDRLPTPFGLVRAGVAPDHQGTKAVQRVFARALSQPQARFVGNVEIGRDLALADLRQAYDAVVLATGAAVDRRLGIPGEDLDGVVGSAAFVGWYNGHPDHAGVAPRLDLVRSVVVIGNGNVAVDVVRVLARAGTEMDGTDLDPDVEAALAAAPLARIFVAGRRRACDVRFSPAELAELGALRRAEPVVDPADLDGLDGADNSPLAVLRGFAAQPRQSRPQQDKPIAVTFGFGLKPEAVLGDAAPAGGKYGAGRRVRAVRFRRMAWTGDRLVETDETTDVAADLVVSCIGYTAAPWASLPADGGRLVNEAGRIEDGLYVAGWAGRSPSGTIATNRLEGQLVADRILAEVTPAGRPGRDGIASRLTSVAVVDAEGWKRIEAAETARASPGRVRRKFTAIGDLIEAAGPVDKEGAGGFRGGMEEGSMSEGATRTIDVEQFSRLIAPVTEAVAGRAVEPALAEELQRRFPPHGRAFQAIEEACHRAIAAGWMCREGSDGRRFGRIIQATPETRGLSVDVVKLRDIVGPHHRHPTGEICMVMPITADARFDGCGRGWKVYPPDSDHHPTVTDGEALVLYLLPDGQIEFTG